MATTNPMAAMEAAPTSSPALYREYVNAAAMQKMTKHTNNENDLF